MGSAEDVSTSRWVSRRVNVLGRNERRPNRALSLLTATLQVRQPIEAR